MIGYLRRTLGARLRAAPALFALTVGGVALGVASVLTIQIINRNALAAFEGSVRAVSGDADLSVLGRTPTFPDSLYRRVLAEPGVAAAWPVYRVDAALTGGDDPVPYFLDVVGVDLFAPVGIPFVAESDGPIDLAAPLVVPGWTALHPDLADSLGLAVGDTLLVSVGTERIALTVGALVDFTRVTPLASRRLAVMDLSQAQALLGGAGRLTQVDLRARTGTDTDALARRLAAALGPGVDVLTPEQRAQRAEGLLRAFRLNLTALSLISLFVGVFLVWASVQASLVRRRGEFGLLRSLGATRRQVLGVILGEVALLGALGVGIGLPLGWWAANANVRVVSATLTNLYLLAEIERLVLPPGLAVLGIAIGVGGALLGALIPALDMTRRDTRALLAPWTLHERLGSAATPLAVIAATMLAGGAGWYLAFGRGWAPAGFVLAVTLVLALPLLAPALVRATARRAAVRKVDLALAARSLGARLQTSAFAVAGLAVAVTMLVGITLMIGSFRATLEVWVASTLRADIYITTPSFRGQNDAAVLDDQLAAALAADPAVASVDRLRGFTGYTGDRRVAIAGVAMGIPGGGRRFPLLAGDPEAATRAVERDGAVLVSEPLYRKTGRGTGDTLPLWTAAGERGFPVAGVYYDYSSENGVVIMDLATFTEAFGPGPVNSIALYLRPGEDADRVADRLKASFADRPLLLRSNRALRTEIYAIFDQTFAITRILQGMALLIAVAGITLTLLILARERLHELALLRAIGADRGQVFRLFLGEGLVMGVLGWALGAAGGLGLAAILIWVINRAWFGWTIQPALPAGTLGWQALSVLAAAVAASLYPAWRASRATAAELRREDV